MKKKITRLMLDGDTVVNGHSLPAGFEIGTVEACCDAGTVASLIRAQAVNFVVDSDELEDEPEAIEDEPESEVDPADVDTEVEGEQATEAAEPEVDPLAELMAAGLDDNLAERLVFNGLTTPEKVREFVAAGNDLVDLDKIGDGYAKKIAKTLGI